MHSNLVDALGNVLRLLIPHGWDEIVSENPIVNLLPPAQQKAIQFYISDFYININKLFRGEKLVFSPEKLLNINNIESNHLIFFILGCLLNDAINKFPHIISGISDKNISIEKYLIPENLPLDRGEYLSPLTIKARLSNPWSFPALTSFSARANGIPYFHNKDTTRTTINNHPKMPIINNKEKEILFSQGTKVVCYKLLNNIVAKIVNSPSLEQPDYRWSDSALAYAHKYYLSKEYLEMSSEIRIKNKIIYRPNHNVTHIFRVMKAIAMVLHYFKKHAKDIEFKVFCQNISDENTEWLRVAAAFSITGRESEIHVSENPQLYAQYRIASAEHFKKYVEKTKDIKNSEINTMLERMLHVVRYIGNPCYEQGHERQPALNRIEDEYERKTRNFYHRILSIARTLDLPRCYTANLFTQAMQPCLNLSEVSPSQQKDLNNMIRYSIELLKAHGSTLSCEMDFDGNLINTKSQNYKEIFAKTSTSLKKLYDITECVTQVSKLKI